MSVKRRSRGGTAPAGQGGRKPSEQWLHGVWEQPAGALPRQGRGQPLEHPRNAPLWPLRRGTGTTISRVFIVAAGGASGASTAAAAAAATTTASSTATTASVGRGAPPERTITPLAAAIGAIPAFSSRTFIPLFVGAMLLRFGPEFLLVP